MAKKIIVRLGKSNLIKESGQIRTPIYLEFGGKVYSGIIVDYSVDNINFVWYDVPGNLVNKAPEFLDIYLKQRDAISA